MGAQMDDLDLSLISALRRDARASISTLSQALGVTRATVRSRIDRLLADGEILGFSVVTKSDRTTNAIRGLMSLGIEGRGSDRIVSHLMGFPEVRQVHSTNGRWDLIVELSTETLEQFDTVLAKIRRIDGIATSETNLLLATRRPRKL